MTPALHRQSGALPLHLQLAAQLQRQIHDQAMVAGSRVASVRDCARRFGVNPQTVVAAYDWLQARGLLESRPRQGFYVRPVAAADTAPAATSCPLCPTQGAGLLRSNLGQAPAELRASPGAGTLPASWLQTPAPARALHQLLRRAQCGEATASYGPAEGDPLLRELLARQLAELDVPARMEDLLLCNGATQALDLVLRALTRPGDAVLVEQPGWPLPFAQAARCGLEQLAVARRGDGPDLQQVEGWARTRRPRLMLLVSRLHNPTGSSLGCACAHRLLELARQYGFLLVEDDVYAALCEQASPLLSAMDRLQRTVLIGGFSKLLAPGWRVGYLAAPPEQMTRLREAKLLGGLASPLLTERALALLLQRGGLHRHAAALRARLARARQLAVHLARQHECRFLFPPRGLFGWVDTGVDTERLARGLHRQGYLIAPGHCFDPVGAAGSCMRLNFAQAQDASFWQAFATMRRALRDDAERGAE